MQVLCAVLAVAAACLGGTAAGETIRGVPLNEQGAYTGAKPSFQCLDGSQTIPFASINDDYCDCHDASDEPGTSACGHGRFFCQNAAFRGLHILSSRVNDGICDCCDGSDEFSGVVQCADTCAADAVAYKAAFAAQHAAQRKGYAIRQQWVEEGIAARTQREAEKEALEGEQRELEGILTTKQELKDAAEAPEKEAKDAFDKMWDETLASKKEASVRSLFTFIDTNKDETLTVDEVKAVVQFDADLDGAVSDEEAEDILDVDGDGTVNETEALMAFDAFRENLYEQQINAFEEVEAVESRPSETKPEYDEAIQTLISAADDARSEYDTVDTQKRGLDTQIQKLASDLAVDLGDQSFYRLQNECFELKDRQYTYKMCPFDKVVQNSGRDTRLGNWKGWTGPDDNRYLRMKYEGGEKCWNGPMRSTEVTLECGENNELLSASEPNRCEYAMTFLTPIACSNPDDAQRHDEL